VVKAATRHRVNESVGDLYAPFREKIDDLLHAVPGHQHDLEIDTVIFVKALVVSGAEGNPRAFSETPMRTFLRFDCSTEWLKTTTAAINRKKRNGPRPVWTLEHGTLHNRVELNLSGGE
jgi:hypothetical protein